MTATNSAGTSPASAASNPINPGTVPTARAQSATANSATPILLHVTAHAANGPYSGVAITTAPTSGTAVVKGLDILYIPDPTVTTTIAVPIGFTISNAYGASSTVTITVTVTPSNQTVSRLRRKDRPPARAHEEIMTTIVGANTKGGAA